MYIARLICSDPDCTERIVAEAETLAELETLACECGCGLDLIGIPDWIEENGVQDDGSVAIPAALVEWGAPGVLHPS